MRFDELVYSSWILTEFQGDKHMIAEIHGKISASGSNLSDRREDQLTGDVFGTLRYINYEQGLIPILRRSYFAARNGKRFYLKLTNPVIDKIVFWRWIGEAEPDVMIDLGEGGESAIISIEVKYRSGLSSDDLCDNPDGTKDDNIGESINQLIRQMRSMKKRYSAARLIQIYLTTDYSFPMDMLSSVRDQADREKLNDVELYWVSWHDFAQIMIDNKQYITNDQQKMAITDLINLFRRKGFERFSAYDEISKCPNEQQYHTRFDASINKNICDRTVMSGQIMARTIPPSFKIVINHVFPEVKSHIFYEGANDE
jgi:hypothetical protein